MCRVLRTSAGYHTHPTRNGRGPSRIPPTQLVDCSYSAHKERARAESHQRSWWIVHTQPTKNGRGPNPTNAVGGLFILSLQRTARVAPDTIKALGWILIQPT